MGQVRRIEDFTAAELSAMPRSARPMGFMKLSPDQFAFKYARCVRHGKTRKDRAAGSLQANLSNKAARVEWQKDPRATNATFPVRGSA